MSTLEDIRKARHELWLRQKAAAAPADDADDAAPKGGRKRPRDDIGGTDESAPSEGEVVRMADGPRGRSAAAAATTAATKRVRVEGGGSASSGRQHPQSDLSPISRLKILSWNVDGLDQHSDEIDMTARTMTVASHIVDERPHVVLLQELIDFNLTWLRRLLSEFYDFYVQSSPPLPYFVGILIDRSAVAIRGPLITDNFATTKMGRALVSLNGEVRLTTGGRVKVHIATAHLESTKAFARPRVEQLKESFSDMRRSVAQNGSCLAVFGGDLNIRDEEVRQALSDERADIIDVWEASGRAKESEFTWDMRKNDNLGIKGKPKARFDRAYLTNAKDVRISPQSFRLTGTERCDMDEVKGKKRFPSDHFGIQFELKVELRKKEVIDLNDDDDDDD
ncbi:Tyrosyl-DNA phosphodiesterase 2 [Perkinsus olseni]|uniref:Tyrosyl-DNA phosphodiesterase 2 n=1 Tax=Perkinsus olseni TaxID=32597 RepID=A0A7J6PXD6_PEROL|nr:Tyrosyl-DNA phosphodiesterase 2 [Perkinsus olseni]KAF4705328.1 Tyrosyl-DNA phosphodiesterase 2 [Perkinsus olseni]